MKKKNSLSLALLTGALFASTSVMAQDVVVTMTTDKAVGSEITLLVNHTYNGVTVDWGDNNPQVYKNNDSKPYSITGQVKGKTISLSGDETWDLLQCSDCGLTGLDLTQARTMRSVYCQNNKLTKLDLKGMTKLTDLNCSNNELTEIVYTTATKPGDDLPNIEYFNVANNRLSGSNGKFLIGTRSVPHTAISVLNISNNNFSDLDLRYTPNLAVLKSSHNKLTEANLTSCTNMSSLMLNDNQITVKRSGNERFSLKLPTSNLLQLIIDNNRIDSLSLANYAGLQDLTCQNNNMKVLTMPANSSLSVYDVRNNMLSFNALPAAKNKPKHCNFLPQDSLDIFHKPCFVIADDYSTYMPVCPSYDDRQEAEYALDLAAYRATVAGTDGALATIKWYAVGDDGQSTELAAGQGKDYSYSSGVTAFFTPQKRVYGVLTQRQYAISIMTKSFAVGADNAFTPTDIESVEGNGGLEVRAGNGSIYMSSASPVGVHIYSIEGKCAWNGTVKSEGINVELSKGIYIVNDKKIIL